MRVTSDELCVGVDGASICRNCLRLAPAGHGAHIDPVAYRDSDGDWQCEERRSGGFTGHDGANVCHPSASGNPESVGGVNP